MTKEIKYDGSEEEMFKLGLVTRDGVAIPSMRNELNLYLKEVESRKKYREDKELIRLGIVDKNGKVLDKKRLEQVEQKRLDKFAEQVEKEREERRGTPGPFRRAISRLLAKHSNKNGIDR